MSHLKGSRAYLSGPIQFGTDLHWRDMPTRILVNEFGIDLFDPFYDPKQQWLAPLKEAQDNNEYEKMVSIAKMFVRKDLAVVDRSDIVIAFLPYKVPTTGTHHEIINSNNAKKPTLLVSDKNNISYIPLWYFGFIPLEFMFPNWDALFQYLRKVNSPEKVHDRWSFIRKEV